MIFHVGYAMYALMKFPFNDGIEGKFPLFQKRPGDMGDV